MEYVESFSPGFLGFFLEDFFLLFFGETFFPFNGFLVVSDDSVKVIMFKH